MPYLPRSSAPVCVACILHVCCMLGEGFIAWGGEKQSKSNAVSSSNTTGNNIPVVPLSWFRASVNAVPHSRLLTKRGHTPHNLLVCQIYSCF